ncbi:MAG TPA: hypothetical protein VI278_07665 [Nitrososphaeraceae archaeon]
MQVTNPVDGLIQICLVAGDIIFTIGDASVKINSDDCGCYPQDIKDRRLVTKATR